MGTSYGRHVERDHPDMFINPITARLEPKSQYKSEGAEVFWESIGASGRSFYNQKYVNTRWQDIPLSVRKEISREMNFQQGKINAKASWSEVTSNPKRHSPMQILEAFSERFPQATESDMEEFAKVVGISPLVVREFLGKNLMKGARLNALILGLVAGAGGVIAGSLLRRKLIERGINESRVDPAIQNALATTYRIHNQRRRLVRKGNSITFISTHSEDSLVMDTVNKLSSTGYADNDELLKLNDKVTFGSESGTIVKLSGNYATVVKEDGNAVPVHIKALMKTGDIIYTSATGMTTWNQISQVEKMEILKNCNLPATYISKTWQDMLQVAKNVIQQKYNINLTKDICKDKHGDFKCQVCGDTFADEAEYNDHKEAHKNKKKSESIQELFNEFMRNAPAHDRTASNFVHQLRGMYGDDLPASETMLRQFFNDHKKHSTGESEDVIETKKSMKAQCSNCGATVFGSSGTTENKCPKCGKEFKKYHYHRIGRDKEALATTSTGGMSNVVYGGEKKKPKTKYDNIIKSESWEIRGIKQISNKAQCANCRCIIKDNSGDRCPECNAMLGSSMKSDNGKCPNCNSNMMYDWGEKGRQCINCGHKEKMVMREQIDVDKIAQEANIQLDDTEEIDTVDENKKPAKAPKPNKAPKSDKV